MANPRSIPPTAVNVSPTGTVMATIDVTKSSTVNIHVYNPDATQTLSCVVRRKAHPSNTMVASSLPDLYAIAPSTAADCDVDCAAIYEIDVYGTASGAGITGAIITVRDEPSTGGNR